MKIPDVSHSLLKMTEIWNQHLDKGNQVGILLMDLSRAFDTTNHSLLLAKIEPSLQTSSEFHRANKVIDISANSQKSFIQ